MKTMILICGAPGSGKTTLAKSLINSGLADEHFEADMFMMENGKYKFDPKKLGYVHKECQKAVENALKQGKNVIVSNTNIKPFERNIYINMANQYNYKVQLIRLSGNFGNVHGVPEEKVKEMAENLEKYWNQ